jgi:hypothetical protein
MHEANDRLLKLLAEHGGRLHLLLVRLTLREDVAEDGTSTRIAGAFGTMEAVSGPVREQSMLGRQTGSLLGTAVFEPRSC